MGFHAHHLVGRVFHDKEARDLLAAHKRDSHGNKIVMHVPADYQAKVVEDEAAATTTVDTAVSVVYVTLPQTFSGEASYVTLTDGATTTAASTTASADTLTSTAAASEASATAALVTALVSAAASTAATSSTAASIVAGHPVAATRSATATAAASSSSSSAMSGGAKAGLAFGILLALGLAAGLVFFCWRRKKSQKDHEEILDEKHNSFADASARSIEAHHNRTTSAMSEKNSMRSVRTTSTAPRLSLRPVTQFLPNLGAATAAVSEKPKSAWERQPSNASDNPFDDATVLSEKQARPVSPPSNPFEEGDAPAADSTSKKHTPQASWEGTEPPTPKSTKFGTAAAVAVAAAGSANAVSPRGPNNVHRVQLDFKPSMEDELELRSGQLVRMLHEYDDGWALCIRMDRSQQGVAPRTCLSKLPVKPRPQGPPSQGARPASTDSNGSGRRPSQGSNGAMVPQPLTPTATAVPSRKPVPGQAM